MQGYVRVLARVKVGALAVALGAMACSSAAEYGGRSGLGEGVRQVGRCEPEPTGFPLPTVNAMVDTATLNHALRDLQSWAREHGERWQGHAVLSMAFQEDGINTRRDLVEHTLSPIVADSLQKLVFASHRRVPETEVPWGARLRVDLGDRISHTRGPRVYCGPRPRSPEMEAAMREFVTTSGRSGLVLLRLLIHPAGYVEGARIIRGGGRGSSLELELRRFMEQFFFEPATLDDVPVYGNVDVPVRVRD